MGIGTLDVILYERTVERALCYFGWFKVEVVGGLIEHPAFVIRLEEVLINYELNISSYLCSHIEKVVKCQ